MRGVKTKKRGLVVAFDRHWTYCFAGHKLGLLGHRILHGESVVPKFDVTIKGTVDGDNPELAYLNIRGPRFSNADDVRAYLADFLSDEVAFETSEIQVVSIANDMITKQRTSK